MRNNLSTERVNILVESLGYHSKERKKLRRKLCGFIRIHRRLVCGDRWLTRKIRGGWLGDLCDDALIYEVKNIVEKQNASNTS